MQDYEDLVGSLKDRLEAAMERNPKLTVFRQVMSSLHYRVPHTKPSINLVNHTPQNTIHCIVCRC